MVRLHLFLPLNGAAPLEILILVVQLHLLVDSTYTEKTTHQPEESQ